MIGIISDIHGNFNALKAVLSELDALNVSKIYCLGDIVGYYPLINECCDELRRRNVKCVLGNHDWYVAANVECARSKTASICASYQSSIISNDNRNWIKALPIFLLDADLSMVHGGWQNPLDEYLKPLDSDLLLIPTSHGASGHTHRSIIKHFSGKTYCNPGSVGQPRDNDPRASFAIYDGNKFSLRRTSYSIQTFIDDCSTHPLPSFIFNRLWSASSHF